jgi:hypothetical protein
MTKYRSKEPRAGYKMSLVLKNGIKVIPIPVAAAGHIANWYFLKVIKKTKTGREIEVKEVDDNGKYITVSLPSVWEKINEIYDYYYNKIKNETTGKDLQAQ